MGLVVFLWSRKCKLLSLDNHFVAMEKDCFMPVHLSESEGSSWEDAGAICDLLNGTLAAVDDDETMLKVN